MADIKTLLSRLGLSEYTTRFRAEGFDTWEVIMDITEADLTYLAVSLTHQKRLQQEISKARTHLLRPCSTSPEGQTLRKRETSFKKRSYRRRPKADTHRPKHPLSAYALFANDIRRNLGDTQLSFGQISRHVGASWQLLGNRELSEWKVQAATTREIYLRDLENYKQTAEYNEYQQYLVNFKLKDSSSHPQLNQLSTSQRSSNTTNGDVESSASLERRPSPTNPSAFPHTQTQEDINSSATTCQTITETPDYTQDRYLPPLDIPAPPSRVPQRLSELIQGLETANPKLTAPSPYRPDQPPVPIKPRQSISRHGERPRQSSYSPSPRSNTITQPRVLHPLYSGLRLRSQLGSTLLVGSGHPVLLCSYFETVLQSRDDLPKGS